MNKLFILFLSAILAFMVVGCTNEKNISSTQPLTTPVVASQEPKKTTPEPKVITIKEGEKIVIDEYCEFVIESSKFAKKVSPSNPGTFYTYYEVKEAGNTYLDTIINIKSLLTSGKTADEFANVKVKYNNKYEYKTFSTIEENGGSNFTYTNITSIEPLKNRTLHFLAEVPEESQNTSNPLYVTITVNKKEYQFNIR